MIPFPANLAASRSKADYTHPRREHAAGRPARLRRWGLLPMPLVSVLALAAGNTAAAGAVTLQVTVTGVRSSSGSVNICVFDSDAGFPDCGGKLASAAQQKPAASGSVRFALDVPAGLHAVSVLHDENGNGRLDTNILGIPREGVGVSNDPPPHYGPPRFAEAAFRLPPEGGQIAVRLVYP